MRRSFTSGKAQQRVCHCAVLQQEGIQPTMAHLPDEPAVIQPALEGYLRDFDLIVLSGGVSKESSIICQHFISTWGTKQHFHIVAQRPGKPFWFGTHPMRGCTVFALPGNPVSSFMCTQVYLRDWLRLSTGRTARALPYAILLEEVVFLPDLTYFLE
ncbi:MAG: molybdopterin-binding protein [Saprospiraceae bacterium]